ncbi:ABC transporter ATP-binding protein [Entomomonas moraniae]|uniref:ABC transporter ATP-binding protein n=1 Tax=Entomomonas moraniae TaxID=2213226 RepID=A0A3S9XCG8_9GAMM|nr:ATP-binding cassette domain-containing protein [Entomomonas moraniae]AZS50110.1 ABC transporter ATP-binding protein [Entomomonas moraniae]
MTNERYSIEITALNKCFSSKKNTKIQALNNVSLQIPEGCITALVGADGAGKTTLLRIICGLLHSDQGDIKVIGLDVNKHTSMIQSRIAYMPQRFGLYEDLTVGENLELYADLHNVPPEIREQRFKLLLTMTNLLNFTDRAAGKLSGGMKQKLGLACTLVRSPRLLLLDEPSVGVDPLSRLELWQIIEQLIEHDQLTVLLSTTYMDEAERCNHVAILHEGSLIAQANPQTIANYAKGTTFYLETRENESIRQLQTDLYKQSITVNAVPEQGKIRLVIKKPEYIQKLQYCLLNRTYYPIAPTLEDGFLVLLSQQQNTINVLSNSNPIKPHHPFNKEVIKVNHLIRKFGNFTAVDDISFSIQQGEIFGLLGPNGAGKTTTFRMLCGLIPATSGELEVIGVNLRNAPAQVRKRIGYVAQKFSLYENLTVKENLTFFGKTYGLTNKKLKERIELVCHEFSLTKYLYLPTKQLVGGYQRRLSMAVGLLHEPDILFLDEPTSGSDPITRREFWRKIIALASTGITIIITTHFMEEAEYCDRILIQDAGKLLALGTPNQVRYEANPNAKEKLSMEQAFINIIKRQRHQQSILNEQSI